jgi:hypothetical protein
MSSGTRRPGRIRVNYASVTATIALFLSLGGASYAAFSLPEHSVGSRDLRAGAVNTEALGFPLGATSATNESPEDLVKGGCNGAGRPGETPPPCVPPRPFGGSSPTQLRMDTHHPGHLLISVIAGVTNDNAAHAELSYAVILDKRAISRGEITLAGGQQEQVPIQSLARVTSGSHTVGFQIRAEYSSYGPGDLTVSPVSIVAVSLP